MSGTLTAAGAELCGMLGSHQADFHACQRVLTTYVDQFCEGDAMCGGNMLFTQLDDGKIEDPPSCIMWGRSTNLRGSRRTQWFCTEQFYAAR